MGELALESDFKQYLVGFKSVFERVLRPGVNFDVVAIVSHKEGALIFIEFKRQKRMRFQYKLIDEPIAKALQSLPQRAFGGDLSGVKFSGKNMIAERNKLIIIKGDNSKTSWSQDEALKDAVEGVNRIAGLPTH